ncbi:uncharacterized protein K441DRAFT_239436 [Cenococcum geophilum 1.58]|uniref:uncharacterized protein n=1 Tax=Cenococcum geophilum 1.58 TaxID=794803 RepID=UPI00358F668A|nr:hypothetical protein K441DRAFT_239436 [Cenococcum geophilum 1.58]
MELMHKDAKYDGPIKVRDVSRWPLDSIAVQFLLITASAYSIEEELAKVAKQASFATHPLTSPKHTLFTYNKTGPDIDDLRADIRANVYKSEFSVFSEGTNFIRTGFPRSDISFKNSLRAFSSDGVRYC